jgi:ketol-acid reductoisomerase
MRRLFDRIDSGEFARGWLEEASRGKTELGEMMDAEKELNIEKAGREVRRLFAPGPGEKDSGGR